MELGGCDAKDTKSVMEWNNVMFTVTSKENVLEAQQINIWFDLREWENNNLL